MILEQSGTLAPANEPWTLIRDAIHDLELQEKQEGVRIDMGNWHDPYGSVCLQCLAGSAISRRLGVDTDDDAEPIDYPEDVRDRLLSIDCFRTGDIGTAYEYLGLEHPASLTARIPIPGYHRGPSAFKAAMRKLADRLEAAQSKPTKP